MYSQNWNCYFQNRINMFCLPVPTLIYLWEIYNFQDWCAYSAAGKYVDRSWKYINHSQTHECGNWDWGRAIPRKGIHKWDFLAVRQETVTSQTALFSGLLQWDESEDGEWAGREAPHLSCFDHSHLSGSGHSHLSCWPLSLKLLWPLSPLSRATCVLLFCHVK